MHVNICDVILCTYSIHIQGVFFSRQYWLIKYWLLICNLYRKIIRNSGRKVRWQKRLLCIIIDFKIISRYEKKPQFILVKY